LSFFGLEWVEVAVGVLACLLAATVRRTLESVGGTGQPREISDFHQVLVLALENMFLMILMFLSEK